MLPSALSSRAYSSAYIGGRRWTVHASYRYASTATRSPALARSSQGRSSKIDDARLTRSGSRVISRSFYATHSASATLRASPALMSPRWLNRRSNKEDQEGEDGEGEPKGEKEGEGIVEESDRRRREGEVDSGRGTNGSTTATGPERPSPNSAAPSSAGSSAPSGSSSGGGGSGDDSGDGTPAATKGGPNTTSISKQTVPEVYPQVLALPITRRPLFPGFYKAVVIRNPAVVAAIKEMLKRGQPYLGAFLLKDEDADSDTITDIDSVHDVGVFAQITSTFPAQPDKDGGGEGLTAVLYPHRRIRIKELIKPSEGKKESTVKVHEIQESAREEGVIPSTPTPSPEDTPAAADAEATSDPSPTTSSAPSYQTSFLQDYAVSLVNVDNLTMSPSVNKKPSQIARAVASEIISVFKDIASLNPLFRDQIANFSMSQGAGNVFEEPDKLADFAAAVSTGEIGELQDVLESMVLEERLQKALLVLKKELMNAQLQSKISRDVESKIQKRQREYYLMEQLKGIKKELGLESDGKDKLIEKFKEKAEKLNMPENARKVFDEEMSKLQTLEPAASEFNVTRNYLDWLTQIPWGISTPSSPDRHFVDRARKILDGDHYGLEKIKKRLVQWLVVLRLRRQRDQRLKELKESEEASAKKEGEGEADRSSQPLEASPVQAGPQTVGEPVTKTAGQSNTAGEPSSTPTPAPATPTSITDLPAHKPRDHAPILLFVGPPGVGKTSIARSLAAAMDRKFHRVSLGGVRDEATIRGHRRTYVGSMPGVIAQGLKKVGVNNPVMLLDEIDKISSNTFQGDPASALLEVLDPEQNHSFTDHYIDVPLDLSGVFFVATANSLDTIAPPLLDRMEVIELSGYSYDEKLHIARQFLLPKQLHANALSSKDIELTDDVLAKVDSAYTREAGVRSLEREIGTVCRAKAVEYAEALDRADTDTKVESAAEATAQVPTPEDYNPKVEVTDLETILGPEKFDLEVVEQDLMAGVATGLAYQGSGNGGILHIECSTMPGKGGALRLTGSLGDVIQESAQIALSWVRTHAAEVGLAGVDDDILAKRDVHLHLPSGAVKKDGPSAGVAMISALVSLLSGKTLPPRLGMTGEVTLRGAVTAVGGIKEKLMAAHRAGITKVILPKKNRKDVEFDLPKTVKNELEIVYVETVPEMLRAAFGESAFPSLPQACKIYSSSLDRI